MGAATKVKADTCKSYSSEQSVSLYYPKTDFTNLLKIMQEQQNYFKSELDREAFKNEVVAIMRDNGVNEAFIINTVTDEAIDNAMMNGFTAENLAWVLLQ